MKAIIIAILLSLSFLRLSAQKFDSEASKRGIPNLPNFEYEKLHFGFLVGFNVLDYHIYNTGLPIPDLTEATSAGNRGAAVEPEILYADIKELNPGLNLGIVTDLRIYNDLNLRCLPGISFGQRDVTFINQYGELYGDKKLKIKSTFIEVPFLLKYSAFRIKNAKPYVVAGTSFRYDLAKDKQNHMNIKSFDNYLDAGAGFDFYLPYFRMSIELRGSFGLRNIYKNSRATEIEDIPYRNAIDCLKSRWYGITFYFE